MSLPRLRVVVFPETSRTWTARMLEHDLTGGGRSVEEALDALLKIARAHIAFDRRHGRQPLTAFAAAPRLYWNAFAEGTRTTAPTRIEWRESGEPTPVVAATLREHPVFIPANPRVRPARS
jgi:hypothetical protein